MTDILLKISDVIYENRENLSDSDFKSMLDYLMRINKHENYYDGDLDDLQSQYYRQFFYHNYKQNKHFNFFYRPDDDSITICHHGISKHLKVLDEFLWYKKYDIYSSFQINISKAKIKKIKPKFTIIEVDGYDNRISNYTLAKYYFYPKITLS